jgi:hypothetical protein
MKKHRKHRNVAQKTIRADKRRAARRRKHEEERKLVRKLGHIAEEIRDGHFEGVRTSPLLALNVGKVTAYLRKYRQHPNLLDALSQ